ncbi:MAG: hypothetical protein KGY76_07540 [Candidatus Thermoplasmatota archaeon]|nr:hypothetical protein [Candidatus Thermoplasmatota archaeon]
MADITGMISRTKEDLFGRRGESKVFYFFIVLLAVFFLIMVLGEGDEVTALIGSVAGYVLLVIIAYSLIDWTSSNTENSEFLSGEDNLEEDVNLRIQETSEIVKRAFEGKEVSQERLEEKIEETFLIKLKEKRNLDEKDVQKLLKDEEEFRKVVNDEVISDFILSDREDRSSDEDSKGWIEKTRDILVSDRKGEEEKRYKKDMVDIIGRIEEWE